MPTRSFAMVGLAAPMQGQVGDGSPHGRQSVAKCSRELPTEEAYLAARETEYTNIRILLMGRAAGLSPEIIRSRLRRINA